jgi:hypothetical protein
VDVASDLHWHSMASEIVEGSLGGCFFDRLLFTVEGGAGAI